MDVLVWLIFAMLVYLICAVPSKRYLRHVVGSERDRSTSLAALLKERMGQSCTLVFNDAIWGIGASCLAGTLVDVDDEWACVECTDEKTGATQLKAVRLDLIRSLEE